MTESWNASDRSTLTAPRGRRAGGGPTAVAVSWSGGKDSALALHALAADPAYRPVSLVSTLVTTSDCLTMHGVPRTLVDAQAAAIGLPVSYVRVPPTPHNDEYERALGEELCRLRQAGVRHIAFGDLFLEDIRAYRQQLLAPYGMTALYPLWGRDTRQLAAEFVDGGFRAIVVCADPAHLDASYCGRDYDRGFLADLPTAVDPCGENGEFHTFVYAAPRWNHPVAATRSPVARRDGFWYCDLC